MLGLWLHNLTSTKVNSLTTNPHFLSKRKFKALKKWLYIYTYMPNIAHVLSCGMQYPSNYNLMDIYIIIYILRIKTFPSHRFTKVTTHRSPT